MNDENELLVVNQILTNATLRALVRSGVLSQAALLDEISHMSLGAELAPAQELARQTVNKLIP